MKKLIGVIIDSMDSRYERRVTEYLIRSAINRSVQLLFLTGSGRSVPNADPSVGRSIFELANRKILEGIILIPSTTVSSEESEALAERARQFTNMPVISVGIMTAGIYSIYLNNKAATEAILSHMLTHVSAEDICYVSGPMSNWEARQRKEAWVNLITSVGLVPGPDNYFEGTFREDSGFKAVDSIISARGGVPGAIIAANDEMAMGIYSRLVDLGYQIPDDVAVVGFDNMRLSSDSFPAITTYDPRIDRICFEAMNAIEEIIAGRVPTGNLEMPGRLIIRESCGCHQLPREVTRPVFRKPTDSKDMICLIDTPEYSTSVSALIGRYIFPSETNPDRIEAYSTQLINGLKKDLVEGEKSQKFITCLNGLLSYAIMAEGHNANFERFMDRFKKMMNDMSKEPEITVGIEALIYDMSLVIDAGVRKRESFFHKTFRDMYMMSRVTIAKLSDASSQEKICNILEEDLKNYGISRCYMVLFKRPKEFVRSERVIYPMMSQCVFGYEEGRLLKPQSFVTENMLPTEFIFREDSTNLLFAALHSGTTHYGYIAMSIDAVDSMIYETIRSQVSEALKRHQINMKRLEAERALNNVLRELELSNELLMRQSVHDELTGLYNRRGFYTEGEKYYHNASKIKEPFYIVFGDIDGLKRINDNYGHDEGDCSIRFIAQALSKVFESNAIVARMSGDEFVALVKNTSDEKYIESMIAAINKEVQKIKKENNKPYEISISLGFAAYNYNEINSMDELLRQADSNLYREKERLHKVLKEKE